MTLYNISLSGNDEGDTDEGLGDLWVKWDAKQKAECEAAEREG